MQQECSCGDSCPLCDNCENPLCECYCDFDLNVEEDEDEENADLGW